MSIHFGWREVDRIMVRLKGPERKGAWASRAGQIRFSNPKSFQQESSINTNSRVQQPRKTTHFSPILCILNPETLRIPAGSRFEPSARPVFLFVFFELLRCR
jgi:hypothetical protein